VSRTRLAGRVASVALVLVAVALAIVGGDENSGDAPVSVARVVNVGELEALEGELGHPVYWAGSHAGYEIELREDAEGSVYLRYLPPGVEAGDPRRDLLTVGTYPIAAPQSAVRRAAATAHAPVRHLSKGGIAFDNSQGSAYLAYPGSDLQIEVYSPKPGEAMGLIRSGAIEAVGG
jgi:hypothetical protein